MKVSTIVLALNELDYQLEKCAEVDSLEAQIEYSGMVQMLNTILGNEFRHGKYTVSGKGQKHVITKVK